MAILSTLTSLASGLSSAGGAAGGGDVPANFGDAYLTGGGFNREGFTVNSAPPVNWVAVSAIAAVAMVIIVASRR